MSISVNNNINPSISIRKNRLKAFNEQKDNEIVQTNEVSFQGNEKNNIDIDISSLDLISTTTTTSLPHKNLKIIENKKDDNSNEISSKEDLTNLNRKKEKSSTTTSSSQEVNNNNNQIEDKKRTDGKKKDKSLGFSTRLSSMWEDMKRMMGFSPDCLNGGYRSIGSRSCTCPQYFEGQLCEQIICANGGTRIKEKTTAFGGIQTEEDICKCTHPIYITGRHCEQVNCQNGGRLLNDGNCQCVDGWYSGNFCQYYTSSWLVAIGIPLLFIAIIILCCVVCRMDLCSLCRQRPSASTSQRIRPNDRRQRRRQHQQNSQNCSTLFEACGGAQRPRNCQNRTRRSNDNNPLNSSRRQLHEEHLQNLYSQQNILNAQQQEQQQQYVVRLERFPLFYNPNTCINDKPLDPPPPYEQAILCESTTIEVPPNYYNQNNILSVQNENVIERNENNNINEMGEEIIEGREEENISENIQQT